MMMPFSTIQSVFFIFTLFLPFADGFRLQGVGVKGTLLCKGAYSVHTNVAIYDVDRNAGDPDDLMDKSHTDRNGRFVLDGTTRELTNIEPKLRIIHDCDDDIRPCHRLLVRRVPFEYIHHGKVQKFYDVGVVELAERTKDEQRTCQDDFTMY